MQLRESYVERGPVVLGDAELVALVLGTGTAGSPVLAVARDLLDRFGGVGGLRLAETAELAGVRGIGLAQAVRVHAALQLGRRAMTRHTHRAPIQSPQQARDWLTPHLVGLADEELHGLYLDRRRRVLGHRVLTRGSQAFTIVDPRQVFRVGVKLGASGVILAHNHPSGDPEPSAQDRDVTARVCRAGRVLGLPLLDHLVIASGGWTSLAERGDVPELPAELPLWAS